MTNASRLTLPLAAALAVLASAVSIDAARAQDGEPRRYTIDLDLEPRAGTTFRFAETERLEMNMTLRAGEQVVNQVSETTSKRFEGERTVLKMEDNEILEQKASFAHASETEGGVETPFAFEGRTVLAGAPDAKERFRWADDGAPILDEKDIEGLEDVFGDAPEEGEPDGENVFDPDGPVAVGESWSPDMRTFAAGFAFSMGGADDAVDLEKSSGKLTLVRVEDRDGVPWGRIEGEIVIGLRQIGPLKLEDSIPARMKVTFDIAIDGVRPDGVMDAEVRIEGQSRVAGPGGQMLDVDIDMRMKMREKRDLTGTGEKTPDAPEKPRRPF